MKGRGTGQFPPHLQSLDSPHTQVILEWWSAWGAVNFVANRGIFATEEAALDAAAKEAEAMEARLELRELSRTHHRKGQYHCVLWAQAGEEEHIIGFYVPRSCPTFANGLYSDPAVWTAEATAQQGKAPANPSSTGKNNAAALPQRSTTQGENLNATQPQNPSPELVPDSPRASKSLHLLVVEVPATAELRRSLPDFPGFTPQEVTFGNLGSNWATSGQLYQGHGVWLASITYDQYFRGDTPPRQDRRRYLRLLIAREPVAQDEALRILSNAGIVGTVIAEDLPFEQDVRTKVWTMARKRSTKKEQK